MGNVQQYCGDHCMSAEQTIKGAMFERPKVALTDYQERCLTKVVSAWKNYVQRKNESPSSTNLKRLIQKLDDFINGNMGRIVSENEFESRMHPAVLSQYKKMTQIDEKKGFESVINREELETQTVQATLNPENPLFLRKPVVLAETGEIYLGYWNLKGNRQGYGKLINSQGELIEGMWDSRGECNYGRIYYKNGIYYEGNLAELIPNGKGYIKYFDKFIYSGNFKNGDYDGEGKIFISNACTYDGHFKNSMLHGEGKVFYQDQKKEGYFYEGSFENNKFHGYGNLKYFKKEQEVIEEYQGQWNNGCPHGQGTYSWLNGNQYKGNYEDGKKKGNGIFYFNNGATFYDGSWSNGKPNGKGLVYFAKNTKVSGMWKLGKLQKIDSEEEFKKINSEESKLNFSVDNEIFSNKFYLYFEFLSIKTDNIDKVLNDPDNGKLVYELFLSKAFNQGMYNNSDKNKVQ